MKRAWKRLSDTDLRRIRAGETCGRVSSFMFGVTCERECDCELREFV